VVSKQFFVILGLLLVVSMWLSSCSQSLADQTSTYIEKPITPTLTNTPVIEPTPTVSPTTGPVTYVVKEGDTLWEIAQSFGTSTAFIALSNNILDADKIYPGQILTIPDSEDSPPSIQSSGKLIMIILSQQTLYVYQDGQSIKQFLVSTGLENTPTPTGEFQIQTKIDTTRMTGPGYDLPNVLWTMYFYQDYGIHGAYWHNNFGQPMSHGCVNMREEDAQWLYSWAPVGTSVLILP